MDVLNIPLASILVVEVVAGVLLLAAGFLVGRYRERRRLRGRSLDDYYFFLYASTRAPLQVHDRTHHPQGFRRAPR